MSDKMEIYTEIERDERGDIVWSVFEVEGLQISTCGIRVMVTHWDGENFSAYCNVTPLEDNSMTAFQLYKILTANYPNQYWEEIKNFVIVHLDYATALYFKSKMRGKDKK